MGFFSEKVIATFFGVLALCLWSLTACVALQLSDIPAFEFLAIIQAVTFAASIVRIALNRTWSKINLPASYWIIGILCIPLNIFGYIYSFRCLNAALADLIYYLYPIFVLVIGSTFLQFRLSLQGALGVILGFSGIAVLIYQDLPASFENLETEGIYLSLASALTWAVYTLSSRGFKDVPFEMVGLFYGPGAIVALLFHVYLEPSVIPSLKESVLLLFWGLVFQSLSITLWEKGIRYGYFGFLNTFSYAIPVLSVALLVIAGYTPLGGRLVFATALVVAGVFLSHQSMKDTGGEKKKVSECKKELF